MGRCRVYSFLPISGGFLTAEDAEGAEEFEKADHSFENLLLLFLCLLSGELLLSSA
jgi:hypothetical protein